MSVYPSIKLERMLKELSNRNIKVRVQDVYSVTNTNGFVPSEETFSKRVFSSNIANYKLVHEGEFAYNPSRINVGSIDYLKRQEPVAISPMYVVFEIDERFLDRDYLLWLY